MGRSANNDDGGFRSSGGGDRSFGGHNHSSEGRSARGEDNERSSYSNFGGNRNINIRNIYYGARQVNSLASDMRRMPTKERVEFSIILVVICAAMMFMTGYGKFGGFGKKSAIPASTIEREALDKSNVDVTPYYEDELGWITSNRTLESGMKYFFDKTGVQPYLVITDNIDGNKKPTNKEFEAYLNELYNTTFTDEQHMIVLYHDNGKDWGTRYLCGKSASAVMDAEACDILLSYIDYYATSDLSEDEMFATSFKKAADKIMTVSTNKFDVMIIALIVFVIIAIIIGFIIYRRMKIKEIEKTQELLNADLTDDSLVNKYGGKM